MISHRGLDIHEFSVNTVLHSLYAFQKYVKQMQLTISYKNYIKCFQVDFHIESMKSKSFPLKAALNAMKTKVY